MKFRWKITKYTNTFVLIFRICVHSTVGKENYRTWITVATYLDWYSLEIKKCEY